MENRLLTPKEIDATFILWSEQTQGDIAKELGNTFSQALTQVQNAKTIQFIIRDLSAILKDADDTRTLDRALVAYVQEIMMRGK